VEQRHSPEDALLRTIAQAGVGGKIKLWHRPRSHGARNVRVFGSVARGDAVAGSDLDLVVDFDSGRSLMDHGELVLDLEAVLGCRVDVGGDFYVVFLYGDVPDASEFLRTARSVWLEIKSDNVEELTRRILDFGVRKLEIPDPHLYFQAPGGQCLRLVGIDEDLSFYEGAGAGSNVANMKEAVKKL